jgi:putative lipoprotein
MRIRHWWCGLILAVLVVSSVQASLKQTLFAPTPDTTLRQSQPTYKPTPAWTHDRWFAQDKANHFLGSLMLSSTAYLGLVANNNDHDQSLVGAIGGTVLIGIGKEIWDIYHPGTPSWRDLTADALGALIGGFAARAMP